MSTAPPVRRASPASGGFTSAEAKSLETGTAPEPPVLEHRAGAVCGNESQLAADSVSTVPREAGACRIFGTPPERVRAAVITDADGQVIKSRSAVQTVHDFGAPEPHGAIQCAPWCTDGAGHLDAIMRADQACWSASNAVVLGLADGAPALPIDLTSWAPLDPPHVAVAAYRAWHSLPVVDLHLYRPSSNSNVHIDFNVKLTAAEAVQLARFLLDAAALTEAEVQR